MSLSRVLKEGKLPPFRNLLSDRLPPAIREKVLFIAGLMDDASLFSAADKSFPEKVSFKAFSSNIPEGSRNEIMSELMAALDEKFSPLYSQKDDKFEDLLTRMKSRPIVINEILEAIYNVRPELYQRIFNRINEDIIKTYNQEESQKAFIEDIKAMANHNYEPGTEINDLKNSLNHLFQYWMIYPSSKLVVGVELGNETVKKLNAAIIQLKDQITKEKEQTPEIVKANEILETISREKLSELQGRAVDIKAVEAAEPVLDLSLAKIAYQLGMKVKHIDYYGWRERNRGGDSGRAKQARNAPPISKAFWSLIFPKEIFPKGVKINKAATMIQEILDKEKRIDPPPDIKTITNYLKTDEKISKLFKPKSVGKKVFHIMQVEDWENVISAERIRQT